MDFSVITQSCINIKIEPERADLNCYADINGLISLTRTTWVFYLIMLYGRLYICAGRGN